MSLTGAAEAKGLTEKQVFEEACAQYRGLNINAEVAWRYYMQTGYLPYFVTDYCMEAMREQKQTPPKTKIAGRA